ncbi:MAG: type secretion system lysozyme-related protein, partial [Myxococcaceae bacterium]|nr:type secretion system lysozyme-related protein [Myxococcaceae bacterium]
RDLSWLLNTTHLAAVHDLSATPHAARSSINFGVRGMAGRTLSSVDQLDLESSLREAIALFEPRLNRESLRVRVSSSAASLLRNALVFHIEAELWAQPSPLALALRTELDLEDGSVTVEEIGFTEGR